MQWNCTVQQHRDHELDDILYNTEYLIGGVP